MSGSQTSIRRGSFKKGPHGAGPTSGTWAANLEYPAADLTSWLARLDQRLAEAVAKDVQLLVMPEYACAQWLHFAPAGLPAAAQLEWLAENAALALPEIAALSRRHLVSLVPGTFPHLSGERGGERCYANRAWLLTSGGEAFYQDKLALTPLEERSVSGVTRAGDAVQIITWMGLRVAIIICLDVEYTRVWLSSGHWLRARPGDRASDRRLCCRGRWSAVRKPLD